MPLRLDWIGYDLASLVQGPADRDGVTMVVFRTRLGYSRHLGSIVPLFLLAFVTALPIEGQVLQGRVTEAAGNGPIRGAFVSLLNEDGESVESRLTDQSGRYQIPAPEVGTWNVRVEHIAYEAVERTVSLIGDGPVRADFTLTSAVLALEALLVEAEGDGCAVDPRSSETIRSLWSRAQQVLRIVSWADEERRLSFELARYTRDLDSEASAIEEESLTTQFGWGSQPFQSQTTSASLRDGFVSGRPGERTFTAPDAHVLLSDEFLDLYCLTPGGSSEDGRLVGIRFQPRDRRSSGGIDGMVWFDANGLGPSHLSYAYTGVDYGAVSASATGRIELEALESGLWYVKSWTIRMPRIGRMQRRDGLYDVLIGFREDGGTVTRLAEGRDVRTASTGAGIVTGTVLDGRTGRPLSGATVFLAGTSFAGESWEDGAFSIRGVAAGEYRVAADHPLFSVAGVYPEPVAVTVSANEAAAVELRTPTWDEIIDKRCDRTSAETVRDGAVLGRLVEGGVAASGAVVASWLRELSDGDEGEQIYTAELDQRGRFTVCGLPRGVQVTLAYTAPPIRGAGVEPRYLGEVPSDPRQAGLRTWDLSESVMAVDAEAVEVQRAGLVLGAIRDAASGETIPGVEVDVLGLDISDTTDREGRFRLGTFAEGRYDLRIRHLAYGEHRHEVLVEEGKGVYLAISLEATPLSVDGVTVVARSAMMETARTSGTRFDGLDEEAVAEARPRARDMATLLRTAQVPGVFIRPQIGPDGRMTLCVQLNRNRGRSGDGGCQMVEVYVDGVRLLDPRVQLPDMDPETVEAFEFLSPVEAGAVYGTGALKGVLVITTRRR